MSQGAPRGALPETGSIQEGKVVRIEPYGAFVDLTNFYRVRGLVHISQLANARVERVEDVVAVDDGVWVKVLSVAAEADGTGRVRHKVSLSIKDVSQDGECTDLGEQQERQDRLKQEITQNLQSSIGMGVALDPMAAAQPSGRKSNLVLKHQPDRTQTVINGYALVDDDEPEPTPPPAAAAARPAAAAMQQQEPARPMGRGRGTTLPAWMTRQGGEGPTKQEGKLDDDSRGSSVDSRDRRHKKRKRHDHKDHKRHKSRKHHKDRKKHHKKHSSRDRRKHGKRSRRDRSYSRSRSRGRSRSVSSASSSPEPRKRRERSRSPSRRSRNREERSLSRSRSPERSRRSRKDSDRKRRRRSRSRSSSREGRRQPFESVEDAQKLIEQLEAKKKRQGQN